MLRRHAPYVLAICLGVFCAYTSVLTSRFAYADDYAFLKEAVAKEHWMIPMCVSTGRIFQGLVLEREFAWCGSVERLAMMRLSTVVMISLGGALIYAHLLKQRQGSMAATAVALFVCTLPPFEVYSFWATSQVNMLAFFLTYPSYRLIAHGLDWWRPRTYWRLAVAVALMWVALNTYQPAAMFICFWFAAELLFAPLDWRTLWRRCAVFVPSFGACLVTYLVVFKLIGRAIERTGITVQPLFKAKWFLTEVLPCTFRFHFILAPEWAGVVCMACVALVVLLFSAGGWGERLAKLALAAVVLTLSYAPNLAAGESWSTYRTQTALMSVGGLLLCYAAMQLAGRVFPRRMAVPAWGLPLGAALAGVALAASNVTHLVTFPQMMEFDLARSQVRRYNPDKHRRIVLVQANWTDLHIKRYFVNRHYDEFGMATTVRPKEWGFADSLLRFAFRSVEPKGMPVPPMEVISAYDKDFAVPQDKETLVVDLRALGRFR